MSVAGREWIAALPPRLERQGRALRWLLGFCESTTAVTSLSVGCSLGRGAADELSDIDAAVGVRAPRGEAGADQVRAVEQALVGALPSDRLVDLLREETSTGSGVVRTVWAQLSDGVQLDLAVVPEAAVRRGDAAPDFVPLHRTEEPPTPAGAASTASAYDVSADQVRAWAFQGWRALLDADKYLRRGSVWEAHQRIEEARRRIWSLWATAQGASYPWHGLSQVLDHDPADLPPGIEATVSGLRPAELRAAALASAAVLDQVGAAAARRCPTTLPTDLAAHAVRVLTRQDGT